MNNCDLCGKETFTEFTVKSKHLRWVLSEDLQKLDTHKNNWLTKNICEDCFKKIFGKPEENYTIEQNCGENRVEGGVLSVSGSVSKKKYRAFKNCEELIKHYDKIFERHTGIRPIECKLNIQYIWVKEKGYGISQLITGFGDTVVKFSPDYTITLKSLFENYEFLDSSPCGCLEE